MPVIGLHCSHEQIPPSRLLKHVKEAEAAGLLAALEFDGLHLHHVGQDLGPFIQAFGERVMPEVQT